MNSSNYIDFSDYVEFAMEAQKQLADLHRHMELNEREQAFECAVKALLATSRAAYCIAETKK